MQTLGFKDHGHSVNLHGWECYRFVYFWFNHSIVRVYGKSTEYNYWRSFSIFFLKGFQVFLVNLPPCLLWKIGLQFPHLILLFQIICCQGT